MRKLRKNNFTRIVLLVASVLFLTSCSKSPENLKAIPKDTDFVSVIDVFSIARKGKLDEISDLKMMKVLKKEMRNENKRVSKYLEEIMQDPTKSGVNFLSDVFLFGINEAENEKFFCVTAELSSEEKFTTFVEKLLNKTAGDFDIKETEAYKYFVNGESAMVWDTDKVIILTAINYSSRENLDFELEELMKLKSDNQITKNEKFNTFYKNKKDVSVWFSSNLFEDEYTFKKLEKNFDYDITDNYFSTYLDFDDGKVFLSTKFTPNEEIKKLNKDNDVYDNDFNKELFNYFPEKSYATVSVSVAPMAYYQILQRQDDFDKMDRKFKRNVGVDMEDVFKSLKGSALLSLMGFENTKYTSTSYEKVPTGTQRKVYNYYTERYEYKDDYEYQNVEKIKEELLPKISFAFDINDDKIIKKLMAKIPKNELSKQGNYYTFEFGDKYPTYFTFNEKNVVFTNDLKSIKSFGEGGMSNNLGNSDIAANISGSNIYAYLLLNTDEYPINIQKNIKIKSDRDQKLLQIWNKLAKSAELEQKDKYSAELIFNLNDDTENSLYTIIKTIDDNYKILMSL